MQNRIVITYYNNCILCLYFEEEILWDMALFPIEEERLKSVYIGKVKNIITNIGAAFVDIAPGKSCYLSLDNIGELTVLNRKREKNDLKQGDEVLVQLIKGGVKTKAPVCSGKLRLNEEIKKQVLAIAPSRSCYSVLYYGKPAYIEFISKFDIKSLDKITCADENIFDEVMGYTDRAAPNHKDKVVAYEDDFSLNKLYKVDTIMEEVFSKRVWLKSGANIVIDYTEAMTVIDVNTAKSIRNKSDEHILNINMEAAKEIFRQLRLRNLSGMILIDFINDIPEGTDKLTEYIKDLASKEAVKTEFIDITGLGIVELTRAKKYKTINETLRDR